MPWAPIPRGQKIQFFPQTLKSPDIFIIHLEEADCIHCHGDAVLGEDLLRRHVEGDCPAIFFDKLADIADSIKISQIRLKYHGFF